ncbi:acyl carrier protein [Planosporangium thailandense]|uniref:Acyl carrier protein n=1 Tax=Planosporangium thailandense TaxID=765197 RepID=A0ABX0XX30_9ACTN|nr:acyl carrier protein [Planosporangium thailandense]NJC69925.1 acyl carrier protein [Planosporangium thailandense]
MSAFTLNDLITIMRRCAGELDEVQLTGDIADVPFQDLGYDSLALLEATGWIAREYAVSLPDDVVTSIETPAELVAFVNEKLDRAA